MPKPDYDTTIGRMAGNIAGTIAWRYVDLKDVGLHDDVIAKA